MFQSEIFVPISITELKRPSSFRNPHSEFIDSNMEGEISREFFEPRFKVLKHFNPPLPLATETIIEL